MATSVCTPWISLTPYRRSRIRINIYLVVVGGVAGAGAGAGARAPGAPGAGGGPLLLYGPGSSVFTGSP